MPAYATGYEDSSWKDAMAPVPTADARVRLAIERHGLEHPHTSQLRHPFRHEEITSIIVSTVLEKHGSKVLMVRLA